MILLNRYLMESENGDKEDDDKHNFGVREHFGRKSKIQKVPFKNQDITF